MEISQPVYCLLSLVELHEARVTGQRVVKLAFGHVVYIGVVSLTRFAELQDNFVKRKESPCLTGCQELVRRPAASSQGFRLCFPSGTFGEKKMKRLNDPQLNLWVRDKRISWRVGLSGGRIPTEYTRHTL